MNVHVDVPNNESIIDHHNGGMFAALIPQQHIRFARSCPLPQVFFQLMSRVPTCFIASYGLPIVHIVFCGTALSN